MRQAGPNLNPFCFFLALYLIGVTLSQFETPRIPSAVSSVSLFGVLVSLSAYVFSSFDPSCHRPRWKVLSTS